MKFNQHVYEQLLLSKISKAQKDSHVISVFAFWGFGSVKAAHKHDDEIDALTS